MTKQCIAVYLTVFLLACMPTVSFAMDLGAVPASPKARTKMITDAEVARSEPIVQPYAPITAGETYDSDDTYFMDVNLSLKIRLDPDRVLPRFRPFIGFTTRFGFYWYSRPNSPVIGKSYNPVFFVRILPRRDSIILTPDKRHYEYREFLNIGYAHQSNGQLIHTPEEYKQQLTITSPPAFANNFIHRGWDYVDAAWKDTFGEDWVTSYLEAKIFLQDGLFQRPADQYHSWEDNSQGKPRKAVDGIEETVDWPSYNAHYAGACKRGFCPSVTVSYMTGYQDPFRYNTIRAEFGFQVFSFPLAIWVQRGYMSSLANYYKNVTSAGIEMRFESF